MVLEDNFYFLFYYSKWQTHKIKGGGDNLQTFTVNPAFLLQDMQIDFFDFQFIMNADWTLKETKFKDQILEPAIWSSLFLIKEKYFKKVKQHKIDKKKLENHREVEEIRAKNRDHLQEHIRRSEAKLSEYKNVILAFWKLATCNSISK